MRYNDVRHGTKIIDDVLKKYWPALQQKKMISANGLFVDATGCKAEPSARSQRRSLYSLVGLVVRFARIGHHADVYPGLCSHECLEL